MSLKILISNLKYHIFVCFIIKKLILSNSLRSFHLIMFIFLYYIFIYNIAISMFGVVYRHVTLLLPSERLSHIRDSPPHSAAVCRESTKIQTLRHVTFISSTFPLVTSNLYSNWFHCPLTSNAKHDINYSKRNI